MRKEDIDWLKHVFIFPKMFSDLPQNYFSKKFWKQTALEISIWGSGKVNLISKTWAIAIFVTMFSTLFTICNFIWWDFPYFCLCFQSRLQQICCMWERVKISNLYKLYHMYCQIYVELCLSHSHIQQISSRWLSKHLAKRLFEKAKSNLREQLKKLLQKEKMLIMSHFSFCHNVFKSYLLQRIPK